MEDALASPYFAEVRDPRQEPTIALADAVSFAFEDLPRLSRRAEKSRLRGLLFDVFVVLSVDSLWSIVLIASGFGRWHCAMLTVNYARCQD